MTRKTMKQLINEIELNEELEKNANMEKIFMPIQVLKANEIKKSTSLNAIIYGPPGIGKTTFLATAPKPLIVDFEGGTLSISDRDIDVVRAKSSEDLREAIKYAKDNEYKTICFDSLTRYTEILLAEILKKESKQFPEFQDWNILQSKISSICWYLQEAQINTIFTCLEKEDNDNGLVIKRPLFNNKTLMRTIPGIMDVVGYIFLNSKKERLLSVNPTNRWDAKHRAVIGKSITEDINPDFQILLNKLLGEK